MEGAGAKKKRHAAKVESEKIGKKKGTKKNAMKNRGQKHHASQIPGMGSKGEEGGTPAKGLRGVNKIKKAWVGLPW